MVTKTSQGCVVSEKVNAHQNRKDCGMPMLVGCLETSGFWARLVVNTTRSGWQGKNVHGGREVDYSLKEKKKGIRWVEEDEKGAPNAPPKERGTGIYIELRGLNTGSKRISHTVTGPEALQSQCRFS
jgi:hypothetical protein